MNEKEKMWFLEIMTVPGRKRQALVAKNTKKTEIIVGYLTKFGEKEFRRWAKRKQEFPKEE